MPPLPAAASLKELSAWQSVRDLYWQSKDYVCCTLKSNMHDMWVAWTITGCLGFVLALMASGRLIYMARQRRKVRCWGGGARRRVRGRRQRCPRCSAWSGQR